MTDFYVYALLDPRKPGTFQYRGSMIFDHEPFYIGKGRKYQYKSHDYEIKRNIRTRKATKIRKIFKETGKLHFRIKLFENLCEEAAFETEIFLIKQIGRLDYNLGPLTNGTDGGDGFANPSEETREKKRIRFMGENNPMFGLYGKDNPNYGRNHSEVTIEKIKNSKQNISKETRELLSRSKSKENHPNFGKKRREETKKKISAAQMGSKNHMYGKHISESAKEKYRETIRKKYYGSVRQVHINDGDS